MAHATAEKSKSLVQVEITTGFSIVLNLLSFHFSILLNTRAKRVMSFHDVCLVFSVMIGLELNW